MSGRRLLLLEGELLQVELHDTDKNRVNNSGHWIDQTSPGTHVQLLALQDVSVTPSALSRPGRDGGVKGTGPDLLGQSGVQGSVLLPLGQDSLDVVGLLGLGLAGGGLGGLGSTEGGGVLDDHR